MKEPPPDRASETLAVLRETAAWNGREYAEKLVQSLGERFGALLVSAGRLERSSEPTIAPVALARRGRLIPPQPYRLHGTPCDVVLEHGPQLIRDRLAERFPEDELLGDLGVQCYIGQPIRSSDGQNLGVIAMLFEHGRDLDADEGVVLEICAARLGAEFEREESQQALLRAVRHESLAHVAGEVALEFNNLLTSLQGNLELLPPPSNAEDREIHQELSSVTTRMIDRTAGLLAASGSRPAAPTPLFLDRLVAASLESLRPRLRPRGIVLEYEPPDVPLRVVGDPNRLRHLLVTLVDRCAAAGDATAPTRAVRLRLQRGPGTTATLNFETGIDPTASPQTSLSSPPEPVARALEDASLEAILHDHGGTLHGDARYPSDRPITVELPLAPSVETGTPRSLCNPAPVLDARPSGPVLIADADDLVRRACRRSLCPLGMDVLEAHCAELLLELLDATEPTPEAVVLDVHLPGLPIHELLVRLQTRRPAPRVLLMSGVGNPGIEQDRQLAVIAKPFSARGLREAIERALRRPIQQAGT